MKKNFILYVIVMVVFSCLAYLFIYDGFNTRTRINVNYVVNPDIKYNVYLKDNDIYDSKILGMNKNYITNLVDYIDIDFDYGIQYDNYVTGYYFYSVDAVVFAYEDDINNSLWEKEFTLLDNKVSVIDSNKIDNIKVNDKFRINYNEYRDIINNFIKEYDMDISGYLMVDINVNTMIDFTNLSNSVDDKKTVKIIIPLTDDSFKINIANDENVIDNYYDFTTGKEVNYLFLVFGALSLPIVVSLLIVIVHEMLMVKNKQDEYSIKLDKILKENDNIIVNVKKFYNKKKYNIIYVSSFDELMDVYNRVHNLINYKRNNDNAMFMIMDKENAWVYILKID